MALRFAHLLRMAWWSVRRAEVSGCNAIIVNRSGDVLLVRHSYQSPECWMLPGGGIGRGETSEQAAVREVAEETGCLIFEAWCFGEETVPLARARNRIHLVAARTIDTPAPDGREIVAAGFFPVAALPGGITAAARSRIEKWREAVQNSDS